MNLNKKINKTDSSKMIRIYVWLLVGLFIVFFLRFTQLMIFKVANGQELDRRVNEIYSRHEVIAAKRGTIYDISGETIAVDVKTYSIYAVLTDSYGGTYVSDKEKTARVLSNHISMDQEDILRLLNQSGINQTAFGNAGTNLNYEVKEAIEAENLEGIYFTEKIARDYPKGYFANSIIGLAQDRREDTSIQTQTNPLQGIMGLELAYNVQLTGIDGYETYDRDFYGYRVNGTVQVLEEAQDGNNLYTTLDSRLTEYLETLMSSAFATYQPESMSAIVVRPKTGDVVAASQRPTFNAKAGLYPENGWVNRFVETAFEPGSTMKVFTLAAAINEGVFSPMDMYRSGSITVGGITINDWNTTGFGTITYLQGLAYSSNVAFVNLVTQIGYDKWKSYLDAFGFGTTTNSGFANEAAGLNAYEQEADKATTSFGQGISVSQLQMLQAFTAIANGGQMQKLRFVDRIENAETKEVTYTPVETLGNPITPETAKLVRTYLEESVYREDRYATARNFRVDDVRISAKTGTAQAIDETTGRYTLDGNYLHSIVAFLPSDEPEYIVYMTMDRPKFVKNSTGIAEVFKPFVAYAMKYIETPTANDETSSSTLITMPSLINVPIAQATSTLSSLGFNNVVVIGDGTQVINQLPIENQQYTSDTRVVLNTGGTIRMPDMINWSRQDVLKVTAQLGIAVSFEGEGFVSGQSITPNTVINDQKEMVVVLTSSSTASLIERSTTTTSSSISSTSRSSQSSE